MDQQRAQIIGRSPALREVLARASRVAKADISVLIQGENGTGKELLAQRIHEGSSRAKKPFEIVNCAAIPKELLESKLFGHKKGAFTGAVDDKPGAFVRADGGTLFLDEIGELAPEHQAKILRAIHEGEVQAVGATETKHVDVRVIAATNRNLRERVASGAFREDLFHRLAGYELHLPALRERGTDVIEIAKALLESEATDKKERFLSRDAQALPLGQRALGEDGAAVVEELLRQLRRVLAVLLARLSKLNLRLVITFEPESARDEFARRYPGIGLEPQRGDGLTPKLVEVIRARTGPCLITGSDCATVPLEHFRQAKAWLQAGTGLVIGPAEDGGTYILGPGRESWLDGIPWSSGHERVELVRRAAERGWSLKLLSGWYDVDRPADLPRVAAGLRAALSAGELEERAFEAEIRFVERLVLITRERST